MSDVQVESAVTQDAPPPGFGDGQDTAQPSETTTDKPEGTEGVEQQDATSNTDTEVKEVNGAESDEQKNQRVQQEERQRSEKRSRGVQKRMDGLTRDKYAERQRAEHLEKVNAELLARIESGSRQAKPDGAANDGQPTPEQYGDYQEYVRADAIWHAEQRARALIEQSQKTAAEERQKYAQEQYERAISQNYAKHAREVAKTIPDFDTVMSEGAHEISVPDGVYDMMRRIPEGPLVAYHMVKNPALAEQFFSSDKSVHGVLLGQLVATLKGSAKVSNAPPPGKPVQAKPGSSSSPPEDTAAYFAWAEKHMR